MRHIGFTGTREGMKNVQKAVLSDLLLARVPAWLHHGVCVGADEQAHRIAISLGIFVAGHPPKNQRHRAVECGYFDQLYPEQEYLQRNHTIVDFSEELIAAPASDEAHSPRSGTWATIRYARKQGKIVTIVHADGTLEFSP
jgi:predicted Rossmann fold nucleotide-binding protein DprA/Smf involved in DNA uptake